MPTRFVIGPAGTGKTHYCLSTLRALEKQGRLGVFLVPEQFTYSADRELLEDPDLAGLRHVRVLSFSRLAVWLRELAASPQPPAISDPARLMLLRKVLARMPDSVLGPLAVMKSRQGLLEELARFIREVRAQGETNFQDAARRVLAGRETAAGKAASPGWALPDWPGALPNRLRALLAVYQGYGEALRDLGLCDPEERLAGLQPVVASLSGQLAAMHFLVDGFLSFTRREREVLTSIALHAGRCEITFCMDTGAVRLPFQPVKRGREVLEQSLRSAGVQMEESLLLPSRPSAGEDPGLAPATESRMEPDPALRLLEQSLYREEPAPPIDDSGGRIRLQSARDPRQEVLIWARQIDQWIRLSPKPCRPSEIAVILRTVEPYRNQILRIFPRYRIPFFLDEHRDLTAHPRARLILDAFDVLLSGWRRDTVITYLRNPLLNAPPAGVDLLENLALEYGYDYERWTDPVWPDYPAPRRERTGSSSAEEEAGDGEDASDEENADLDEDEEREEPGLGGVSEKEAREAARHAAVVAMANQLRGRLLQPLMEAERTFKSQAGESRVLTGGEAVAVLRRLEEAYDPGSTRGSSRNHPSGAADPPGAGPPVSGQPGADSTDADWDRKARAVLDELLEDAARLWADVPVSLDEFARALREGCTNARVGLTPRRLEQVVVGDIQRSRLQGIRHAIVGGLNDGSFPPPVKDDLILTESERGLLAREDLPLGPSASERLEEELYFFYIALTRASRDLLLTWSRMNLLGKPMAASLFLQEVERALPGKIRPPASPDPEAVSPEGSQTPEELGARLVTHVTGRMPEEDNRSRSVLDELYSRVAPWELPRSGGASEIPSMSARPEEGGIVLDGIRRVFALSLPSALYRPEDRLPEELIRRLLRENDLVSSVSRLQQFAACPYQSFAQRILRLLPRPSAEISPLQTGSVAHAALERFLQKPVTPDRNRISNRLTRIFRELKDVPEFIAFQVDESNAFRWRNIRNSLERFLRMEAQRLDGCAFQAREREIPFGPQWNNAVTIPLPDGRRLVLVGRVDRLDVMENENETLGLVIDYKKRPRTDRLLPQALEEGLDLQLSTYLLFVRDVLRWRPVGGLYVPVLPTPKPEKDLDPEAGNPLRIRASGLILRDFRDSVDQDTGLIVGATGRSRQILDAREDLDRLLDLGRDYLASFAATQMSGWIGAVPLQTKPPALPCDHCDYGAVCRFRRGTDPTRRRAAEGMLHPPSPEEA